MDLLHPQIVVIGRRRYRKNNNMSNRDVDNQLVAPYMEETDDCYEKTDDYENNYNDEPNCDQAASNESNEFKGIEKYGDNNFKLVSFNNNKEKIYFFKF